MNILDTQALNKGLMEELALDRGSDAPGRVPPDSTSATGLPEDDEDAENSSHVLDVLDIAGRRYQLDCRIDRITRIVLAYSLSPTPDSAIA